MKRFIFFILLFSLSSCQTYWHMATTATYDDPIYIDDVRVDVIENRTQLNWKLRTDFRFRNDFAWFAQSQPYSWYLDNSWELGLYSFGINSWDFYWNRSEFWWSWSFNYPFYYTWHTPWYWNRWDTWYGWNSSWYWNRPFSQRHGYGYVWNRNDRDYIFINGRRGSNNVSLRRGGSSRGNNIIISPNGVVNNGRGINNIRDYHVKPDPNNVDVVIEKPRRNVFSRILDKIEDNGVKIRTYNDPNNVYNGIRPNNNINNNRTYINNSNNINYNRPRVNNNINNSSRNYTPPPRTNRSSSGVSISRGSRGGKINN
jgi:hypothetical protein